MTPAKLIDDPTITITQTDDSVEKDGLAPPEVYMKAAELAIQEDPKNLPSNLVLEDKNTKERWEFRIG